MQIIKLFTANWFSGLLTLLVTLLMTSGCKNQNTEEVNEPKVYTEITDSSNYFKSYDDIHITGYKFFNNKLAGYNQLNEKIQIYDEDKKLVSEFSSKGKGPGELISPSCIYFDEDGIFVLDAGTRKIVWFNEKGELIKEILLKHTATNFTKIGKDMIISSFAMYDNYLYKCKIDDESKFEGFIPNKNKYTNLDVKKIFADTYNITSNSTNIYLTKMYKDSLLTYSLDGKLISRLGRGMRDIENPEPLEESSVKIIMGDPLNWHITSDVNNNVYLLSQNPKNKKYAIYEYSQSGSNTGIYELPFKSMRFEVLAKGQFLVMNDQNELKTLVYKTN